MANYSFQDLILTTDNIRQHTTQILRSIEQCTFIALDTEFSGLGDFKALCDKYFFNIQIIFFSKNLNRKI
jgi:hypothetical protein